MEEVLFWGDVGGEGEVLLVVVGEEGVDGLFVGGGVEVFFGDFELFEVVVGGGGGVVDFVELGCYGVFVVFLCLLVY